MRTLQARNANAVVGRIELWGNLWIYLVTAVILVVCVARSWAVFPATRNIAIQNDLRKHVTAYYTAWVELDHGLWLDLQIRRDRIAARQPHHPSRR